jgi:uncharacterized iron-regulated membrane protein
MLKTSIQLHKWIGLVVGLQVLFWVLGGLIMTALPIEKVRGEHHIGYAAKPVLPADALLPLAELARRDGGELAEARLRSTPNGPVWVLTSPTGRESWYDARTGGEIREVTEAQVRQAAVRAYAGPGRLQSVSLLDQAPVESGSEGSIWRASFADREGSTLYLDPFTADVVSRRSDLWRFYDFFYRLHIMNFGPAETYNHPLIVFTTAVTLVIVITGFILLWFRVARDIRGLRIQRSQP